MDQLEYATKFHRAMRFALARSAHSEAEDFAAWYVAFGEQRKRLAWNLADYFRQTYGRSDARSKKGRARVTAKHLSIMQHAGSDRWIDTGRAGSDCDLMRYGADAIDARAEARRKNTFRFRTSYRFETEAITPGSVPGRRRVRARARLCGLWWRSFVNLWPVIRLLKEKR